MIYPTDELLSKMSTVLRHGDHWQARAHYADFFAKGATPREAMERALMPKVDKKSDENSDLF